MDRSVGMSMRCEVGLASLTILLLDERNRFHLGFKVWS